MVLSLTNSNILNLPIDRSQITEVPNLVTLICTYTVVHTYNFLLSQHFSIPISHCSRFMVQAFEFTMYHKTAVPCNFPTIPLLCISHPLYCHQSVCVQNLVESFTDTYIQHCYIGEGSSFGVGGHQHRRRWPKPRQQPIQGSLGACPPKKILRIWCSEYSSTNDMQVPTLGFSLH